MKILNKLKSKLAVINLPELSPVLKAELNKKGLLTLVAEVSTVLIFGVVIIILMVVLGNM